MKVVTALVFVVGVVSCAHPQTRVASPAAQAPAEVGTAGTPPRKIDRSGTVEQQLARLQDAYDQNAEAVDFLSKVYAQQKAQHAEQERNELDDDAVFAVDVTGPVKAGQVAGPADAPVTVIKAFDFACPYCRQMAPVVAEVVHEYQGKVRVVYANMVVHAPARPAHLASCAAAKQGKYNEFKDAFWDKGFDPYAASGGKDTSPLGEDNLVAIAKSLGLGLTRFKADMASAECAARIESDMKELEKFHVSGTPTFFINGKHVGGAVPKEEFKRIIDEQLRLAEASGVPAAEYYQKVVMGQGEKQFRAKGEARPR